MLGLIAGTACDCADACFSMGGFPSWWEGGSSGKRALEGDQVHRYRRLLLLRMQVEYDSRHLIFHTLQSWDTSQAQA